MKKLIFALVILLLSAGSAFCGITNVTVSEDVFVDSYYHDKTMGTTKTEKLWVGETVDSITKKIDGNDFTRSYLKFNLSGYSSINSASLYILKDQGGTQGWNTNYPGLGIGLGNITVYQYKGAQDWNEATLTWDNAPGPFSDTTLYVKGNHQYVDNTTTWVNLAVTSWAQDAVGGNLTLVLASPDPFSIYYSSENIDNAGYAPYLKVNGSMVPEPISTTLFLLGAGAFGLGAYRRKKKV